MRKLSIMVLMTAALLVAMLGCGGPAATPVPPTAAPPAQPPPTGAPVSAPTTAPAAQPTTAPTTGAPTAAPQPTSAPQATAKPPTAPPAAPTVAPTVAPTNAPAAAGPVVTSKELNLYGWSEYIPQALLDEFSKEYGVTVNYDTYASNEELMAKLQAGAKNYDVIIPSDYTVNIMIGQNLLEPVDINQIPNFANVDSQFKNPSYDPGNKYTVPYQWGSVAIAVNTAKVTKPITKYADLWDPDFKNALVVLDDEREVIGMTLLTLGYNKNSTDPRELKEAKQKLMDLKRNIKVFDSDSPKTELLSGETVAGLVWNGEAALAHRENPKIVYVIPSEGMGIWVDNLAVPKDPPHKDAALAFLNFVLRPDMSVLITQAFPYSSVNKPALDLLKQTDPKTYAEYMSNPANNPTPDEIKNAHNVIDVGNATTLYDQIWTDIKSGQ
jgi:spermidine/putrescine-binding protein